LLKRIDEEAKCFELRHLREQKVRQKSEIETNLLQESSEDGAFQQTERVIGHKDDGSDGRNIGELTRVDLPPHV
jgi:hypothetical protein